MVAASTIGSRVKLGMNLLLWTTHLSEEHLSLLEEICSVGYDGVEIPVFEGEINHYIAMGSRLDDMGLGRTAVTVMAEHENPASLNATIRQASLDRLKWVIDRAHAIGCVLLCGPLHSGLGVFTGEAPNESELKYSTDILREAGEHAARVGVRLAVEPLNRFECYLLNTSQQGRCYVDRVDHPAVGLMYDTFHTHIEERSPVSAIEACGDRLWHVHISANHRGTPGQDQIQWASVFDTLKRTNYQGWLTIESFGRSLLELTAATKVWRELAPSREAVVQDGYRFMRGCWGES